MGVAVWVLQYGCCSMGVAVCCSVNTLQHIVKEYSYSFLQKIAPFLHLATHCNTLQHTATHCNTLQHTATHILLFLAFSASVVQCVAVCCSVVQCVAVCCSVLHLAFSAPRATHCNTLQHTVTHNLGAKFKVAVQKGGRVPHHLLQCAAQCVAVCCSVLQ